MRYVVTAREMRALDAATIEGHGLPGAVLMENAGREVARFVLGELGAERGPVAVVCGAGNNGGDGYVVARCLRAAGVHAVVYLAAAAHGLRGDARLHHDVYQSMGGRIVEIADEAAVAAHAAEIEGAGVVVDALFGTGLARAVDGHHRRVIEAMNQSRGRRVAIDIPSGLSADTGEVLGVAVNAHATVTMAFLKVGLVLSPGFVHAGAVHVAEIGIPEALARDHGVRTWMVEPADVAPLVPRVSPMAHKNRRGHVLAVAGSPGKRGAARLLSWAALRAGAGLVTVASPWAGGEVQVPDPVMTAALDADTPAQAVARLGALAEGKQVVAMGPGMPTSESGRALVRAALAESEVPLVLDADALNHVGTELGCVAAARAPVILTPHPGEAARLLGCTASDVQRDRLAAARALARASRAVVVLKGARTLVCDGEAGRSDGAGSGGHSGEAGGDGAVLEVSINPTATAGLATAGSGDVLTGVIAALVAQGVPAAAAARLGVYLHGRAGERAVAVLGERSVTAADLAEHLPRVLAELDRGSD